MSGWTDAHCHVQEAFVAEGGAAPEDLLVRAREAGVERVVVVGTDARTSRQALDLAAGSHAVAVYAVAGLHPHDATQDAQPVRELLAARPPRLVGVGETGLDYYYEHAPRAAQRRAFALQVGWAHEFGLALVIHAREAVDDVVDVLASEGVPPRTVIHCFTGGPDDAARYLEAGCDISVAGIVTFKNAESLRDAVRRVPLDRLHVETDSPFLAPVPLRGRANEPANVAAIGACVAELRGEDVATLQAATAANTARLFAFGT